MKFQFGTSDAFHWQLFITSNNKECMQNVKRLGEKKN